MRPRMNPVIMDSTGKAGIGLVVAVAMVEVEDERFEVVSKLVYAVATWVTVDTTVEVEVTVRSPPNGEKRSIVDSGPMRIGGRTTEGKKFGEEPTIQPLLEVIM
jgi:hypothetical protein